MTHTNTSVEPPAGSRSNRAGIWVFMIAGIAIIIATATLASLRIAALLSEPATPFTIDLVESGTSLETQHPAVSIDRITFEIDNVPGTVLAPAIIEQAVLVLTTVTVIACLVALAWSTLRGRIFSRSNTRLAATAAITGLVGYGVAPEIGNIAAHEAAFSAGLTDSLTPSLFTVDPFPFIMAAFAASIVITAFTVGERLQRDTEGLI